MKNELAGFQDSLDYKFKNIQILETALTHSSYANENKSVGVSSNERLEFLGDSVLNLIVSNHVFSSYPDLPEGQMTKIRASVVCEPALKEMAVELGVGNFIKLGKGEEITGGRERPSILSDAFESIVGAIYIDGGYQQAEAFVLRLVEKTIEKSAKGLGLIDYKTKLQEELQKKGDVKIKYEVVNEIGPDHNKQFFIQVECNGKILGVGQGKSKKEAEQRAAENALKTVES